VDDATEFFEERIGIVQFDGGSDPVNARYYAMVLTRLYCRKHKLKEPELQYFRAFVTYDLSWSDEEATVVYKSGQCIPGG
jgi:hypothetical protein